MFEGNQQIRTFHGILGNLTHVVFTSHLQQPRQSCQIWSQ